MWGAEATLASWARWVCAQAAVAWWVFGTRDSPLPGVPRRVVPRWLGEASKRNIVAKDRKSKCGGATTDESDEELVDHWVEQWFCFSINHGIGGLIMLWGILSETPSIWRVGLTFEMGEDILHSVQMLAAVLFGVGPCVAWKRNRFVPMILHHSLGLVAGVPAFLLLSEWRDVQVFSLIMLGAPVPGMALEAAFATCDHTQPGAWTVSLCLTVGNAVWWIYCRFVLFLPICMRVLPAVASQYGMALASAMGVALCSFSMFNIILLYVTIEAVYLMLTASTQEEHRNARRLRRAATSSHLLIHSASQGALQTGIVRRLSSSALLHRQVTVVPVRRAD